jgi:hypothetical protein
MLWDSKEEDFLKLLERQCNAYHKYFMKDFEYYKWLSNRFNVPILVISSINALCAIALNDFLVQKYVSILNAVLSAGTGLLGSVQLYLKINEKMTTSMRSSISMKRLALNISKELSISADSRTSEGKIFLQECFADFNACLEQSNPVHRKFQNYLALEKDDPNEPSTFSESPSTTRSQKILNYFRMARPVEYSEP